MHGIHDMRRGIFAFSTLAALLILSCSKETTAPEESTPTPPPEITWADTLFLVQGEVAFRLALSGESPWQRLVGYLDGRPQWELLEADWQLLGLPMDTVTLDWDSRTAADGPHALEARLWDAGGRMGISPARTVWVDNQPDEPPALIWIDPPPPPWQGSITLAFRLDSPSPVAVVRFFLDTPGTPLDSLTTPETGDTLHWTWDTGAAPPGVHLLFAEMLTLAGQRTYSAPLPVTLETESTEGPPPSVTWVDPPAGPVKDVLVLRCRVEADTTLRALRLRLDADPDPVDSLTAPQTGDTLELPWDSRMTPDGFHLLYLEAEDLAGRTGSAYPLPLEVRNLDRTPPVVRWTYPETGGRLQGIVGLPFHVDESGGIRSLRLYRSGTSAPGDTLPGGPEGNYMFHWNSASVPDGYYTFEVFAVDSAGNEGRSPVLLAEVVNQALPSVILVPEDYATLQAGINAARTGDTVRVAPGVYNEGLNFFGKNLWFESTDGPELTTIDATGWTYGILVNSGEDTTLVMRGFTIENAVRNGIFIESGAASIYNCIFKNNNIYGIICLDTNPNIINCVSDNNYTNYAIAYSWGRYYNNISVNAISYGIWNIAVYPNPLELGYNLYYNNYNDFNEPPLQSTTDLFENPIFITGTYILSTNSPCIDAGHPDILDTDGTRSDIGVYGGPHAYAPPD